MTAYYPWPTQRPVTTTLMDHRACNIKSLIPPCCANMRVGQGRAAAKDGCYQKMVRREDPTEVIFGKDEFTSPKIWPRLATSWSARKSREVSVRDGDAQIPFCMGLN